MKNDLNKKEHLPLFGVGPLIVFGQYVITAAAIILSYVFHWDIGRISALSIPLKVLGIALIVFGEYIYFSAVLRSKLFKNVENNNLVTDGIYGFVRNPIYSCALLDCTGAVLFVNKPVLLVVPVICWAYMTVFLMNTEEKWLSELYGDEYADYCKRVNRCIPWFNKYLIPQNSKRSS